MRNFKGEAKAIEIKGKNAEDLIAMLNKMFGPDEEYNPTEIHVPEPEQSVSEEMECALQTKALFDAHVAVGFTEEQSFEIVKAIIMA